MDWFLPYYWAVGLSASGIPMTSWGLVSLPLRDPDGRCADPIDLDVELVLVLYEVLVERVGCGICGAPLNPAVNVELAVDPSPAAGSSWPHGAVDRGGTAKWQEWSNETVSFGSAGLSRATGLPFPAIDRH